MTVRNLDKLFKPQSVAVIGASRRPRSVGAVVMRNLLQAGFPGPIMPVNPKYRAVAGVLAYPDVESLPEAPDLAILCTPPATIPGLIGELGKKGTRGAIVLTAGLAVEKDETGRTLTEAMLEASRPFLLRILGPNCIGALVPAIGLNASFAHVPAEAGTVAFASQSGALCTAVLDWARARDIGFSHFISLGNAADVDFGDVVDYLGSDPKTRAILLYIEAIRHGRKFMSACRAAARNKPLLVIKAGRMAEGARAAASHTGALAGADAVYEAAIRRAGMLRVYTVSELFAAVETLARGRPLKGERLAIVTNGGGIGVMAVDDLVARQGRLAELSKATLRKLNRVLPPTWSHANPVDIIGDAPATRYASAVKALCRAKEVDAVMVMHVPTAIAPSTEIAEAVIAADKACHGSLLTSWVGGEAVAESRRRFAAAGIPTYETPGEAVGAFMHMVTYRHNQETLMETPPSIPAGFVPATATARRLVQDSLTDGHAMMDEVQSKGVLAAYGIPTVTTRIAADPREAAAKAREIGFPVAMKILSPDITHKSDVGGVRLFLESPEAVIAAAENMLKAVSERSPKARIEGFTVQPMAVRPGAHEVIVGVTGDPVFGPVILFGQGGTAVEIIADRAVALPPLNMNLARELVGRTRVSRLLRGYRDRPPADMDALYTALVQISQMIVDIPEIQEMDINPLLADETGVLALDARIRVAPAGPDALQRLAIRPYPKELEETYTLKSGRRVLLRPIRPEDEPEHYELLYSLTPEDIRFRFFGSLRDLPHSEMARFTQIDYDREMAFIASAAKEDGGRETLGVVRAVTLPDHAQAEFAIIVRSDLKGQGLGRKLLEKMIAYCRDRGIKALVGQVLADNERMLALARKLGFRRRRIPGDDAVEVSLAL